ncbi:MAG: hypothetical protein ACTSUT_20655 [Promethearchaeota archaeon]
MVKEKKKKKIGIKTTRYFTKTCSNCNYEYPNWFTHCPQCKLAWDDISSKDAHNKNIKIIVKITEENYNEALVKVLLIFSANQGKSWYQMEMDIKVDYLIAEITEVPIGSVLIYYIEIYLANGEKIIENNDGKYYNYKVGGSLGEIKAGDPQVEFKERINNIKQPTTIPQEYDNSLIEQAPQNLTKHQRLEDMTLFGKRQIRVDQELKICPHCNSKIKKMWSICPICGNKI